MFIAIGDDGPRLGGADTFEFTVQRLRIGAVQIHGRLNGDGLLLLYGDDWVAA